MTTDNLIELEHCT